MTGVQRFALPISLCAARGLVSFNGSNCAEAHYDVMTPAPGQWNPATATFEDQIIVSPFARRSELRAMPLYGPGSVGTVAKTEYQDRRTELGVLGSVPLASWLAAGGVCPSLLPPLG